MNVAQSGELALLFVLSGCVLEIDREYILWLWISINHLS